MAATATKGARSRSSFSIKTIWGLARCPELSLSDVELYALIERETGKDSMRKMNPSEIDRVCRMLVHMKDDTGRAPPPTRRIGYKRTDEGGNPGTVAQRRKIYMLALELGWSPDDVNRFIASPKTFGIARQEWLTPGQCRKLIEILKDKVDREREKAAGNST